MDDIERHAALIDAGWRVGVDGKWISPDPNHARFYHAENDAVQCSRRQDVGPALGLVGRLRSFTLTSYGLPDPREGHAGKQSADHAADHPDRFVHELE